MGRRVGQPLSREDVVEAAIRVIARDGADALGTARVAAELGIRPPSIYHHFHGNDALKLAVATEGWGRLVARLPAPGADVTATLRAYAWAYRGFALENGELYRVMTSTGFVPTDPALLAVTAGAAAALAPLGLAGDDVIHAIRGFRAALHGFVDLELAGQLRLSVPADESFDWLVRAVVSGAVGQLPGSR